MKAPFSLLLSMWMLLSLPAVGRGYDPTIFPSYQNLPPLAKPWFKNLAGYEFYPTEIMRLAKVPEAEIATVELMKHIITDPDGDYEHLVDVIGALRERDDFSAEHQAWLRELLLSKLGRTKGAMESYLKGYGPGLLKKYPSPENEDLMIKYLKDKDVYNVVPEYDFGSSISAVRALEKIGTAKCLGPLREHLEQFKPDGHKEVSEVIAVIEEREKQRASDAASTTTGTKSQGTGNSSLKTGSENSEQPSSDSFSLAAIVLLAALALGGLTLHQWRKARRK